MSKHTRGCKPTIRSRGKWVGFLCVLAASSAWQPAAAADFFVYLQCDGRVNAGKDSMTGNVSLALRDNNTTALIQKSNVMPVGERLKYDVSPVSYSMSYRVPGVRSDSVALYDWWRGALFVWQPNLKRVAKIRMSIDRSTGDLAGEMLNSQDERLASMAMNCKAIDEADLPAPKF